jgi:hypothetical protein
MAVPTISNLSPTQGPSRGYNVLVITGTNFRTRALTYAIPWVDLPTTCSVTVNGRAARKVWVRSSTEIGVLVPQYRGGADATSFAAVDVVVTNLDDDGNPIAGETVTSSGAYTYKRPDLAYPKGPPPFLQVLDEFLRMLKREIAIEGGWMFHSDYGRDGEEVIAVQEHPTIGVRMDAMKDPEYGDEDNVKQLKDLGSGVWAVYRPPETYMLVFELLLSAANPIVAQHLVAEAIGCWRDNQEIEVDGDPLWDPGGSNIYPLEMPGDPVQANSQNKSNIVAFSCQMRVRGIPVLSDEPIEQVHEMTSIFIACSNLVGSSFSTLELP